MGYFDTDHLNGELPSIGVKPGPTPLDMIEQSFEQTRRVDSPFALEAEVQDAWKESLDAFEKRTGQTTGLKDAGYLPYEQFINAVENKPVAGSSLLVNNMDEQVATFHQVNEQIKALGDPNIKSFEQVLQDTFALHKEIEGRTAQMGAAAEHPVDALLAQLIGGTAGSMTSRDPFNLALGVFGGAADAAISPITRTMSVGRQVATRVATDMATMGGVAAVGELAYTNPNRQLAGLPAHDPTFDIVTSMLGAGVIRGLHEGALRLIDRAPTDEEIHTTLAEHEDSPRARAADSILEDVRAVEEINPYGEGEAARARFVAELDRMEQAMSGNNFPGVAPVAELPELPFEQIEKNADFELVKEQAPETYARLETARQAIVGNEEFVGGLRQQLDELEKPITSLEQVQQLIERHPDVEKPVYHTDPALMERETQRYQQRLLEAEAKRQALPSHQEAVRDIHGALYANKQLRARLIKEYGDAYRAVQGEADRIRAEQTRVNRLKNAEEIRGMVRSGEPLTPLFTQSAEDMADIVAKADEAMPETVDRIATTQPNEDGTVDIGLEKPVPADRWFYDEDGKKMSFGSTMADLADDDAVTAAMKSCLL